ncbi:hypothetical protein ANO11243_007800 [Dothideomycetidae sp. 11243]|nr:hypothetical protein ANO11243_007800 [fungal sp. No.11243]
MTDNNSRIIIVGGGPVGLTAAHALHKAGLDFLLLESRPEIVADAGSGLVLSAMGLRALSQLGLLSAMNKESTPVDRFKRYDHKGKDIGETMFFTYFYQSHGALPRVFRRRDLMRAFWDTLPAECRTKVLPGKRVSAIHSSDDGVVVCCADGSSYPGSLVIGADGAYSVVRKEMDLAQQRSAPAPVTQKQPFLTTYRCFWLLAPTLPHTVIGDANETHGPEVTVQFFAGEESAIMGVYERLESPTRDPPRYTQVDEEAFIAKWGHLPLTKEAKLTLGEAYAQRIKCGLVNLEEGVVKHWSRGRMVLVGDAAHKFTPSTGSGCNNGIVDVVSLANQLHRAFASGTPPTSEALSAAFTAYQEERFDVVKEDCGLAGNFTAMATWNSFLLKFLDVHVFAYKFVQRFLVDQGVGTTAKTPVFDYIEGKEEIVGSVPWVHAIPPPSSSSSNTQNIDRWSSGIITRRGAFEFSAICILRSLDLSLLLVT